MSTSAEFQFESVLRVSGSYIHSAKDTRSTLRTDGSREPAKVRTFKETSERESRTVDLGTHPTFLAAGHAERECQSAPTQSKSSPVLRQHNKAPCSGLFTEIRTINENMAAVGDGRVLIGARCDVICTVSHDMRPDSGQIPVLENVNHICGHTADDGRSGSKRRRVVIFRLQSAKP